MCLLKSHKFPKIAWKPIKVYKIIIGKDKEMYTPYQRVKVPENMIIKSQKCPLLGIFRNSLEAEGVHAFTDKEFVQLLCKVIVGTGYEAVIPRFSLYYIGEDNDICASKIKLIKAI